MNGPPGTSGIVISAINFIYAASIIMSLLISLNFSADELGNAPAGPASAGAPLTLEQPPYVPYSHL
jgi:hypothetical protein